MKTVWHYHESGKETVADVYKRKVTHVVEYKKLSKHVSDCCSWIGELDDGRYFSIYIIDCFVYGMFVDRENEFKTKRYIDIAYEDCVKHILDVSDDYLRLEKLFEARETFVPEFVKNLTFDNIMEIFMWEYSSPNVEVYDYFLV